MWHKFLQEQLESRLAAHSKPILFLINPKSGSGRALSVFSSQVWRAPEVVQVEPVLREAGVQYEMVLTTRANHGRQLVAGRELARWRAVITVSGDGLVHEVPHHQSPHRRPGA